LTILLEPGVQFEFHAGAEGYFERPGLSIAVNREPGDQMVTFELEPDVGNLATLTLVVRDDAGNPVGPLMVERYMGTRRRNSPVGKYVLTLPAGSHEITLRPPSDQVVLYRKEWYSKHQSPDLPEVDRVWLPKTVRVKLERGASVKREITMQRAGLIWIRTKPGSQLTDLGVFQRKHTVERPLWSLYENKGDVALVKPGDCEVRASRGWQASFRVEVSVKAEEVATVWLPPPRK
jgi:hypothetical protein